jgi:hypothetical protein
VDLCGNSRASERDWPREIWVILARLAQLLVSSPFLSAFFAARSRFPLICCERSPTGRVNGKSTASSNWTASKYQTIIVKANVKAPAA